MESFKDNKVADLTYLDWNNKIAEHFFNPQKEGVRVWFSVEKKLIDEIAKKNNTTFDDFIKIIKDGPEWINRPNQTICSKAHAVFQEWNESRSQNYPPYIAYLALFVLAVNHGDNEDFSEGNYYGRLSNIVGESLSTSHFKNIPELWDDLEKWSLEDKKGEFGEFHCDIYGSRFYVGIPQYQVVLTEKDKQQLPKIFLDMGWDSDSSPTEQEILQALKNHQQSLSSRTSKRISKGKSDFLSVLTDRVLEELKEYDEETLGTEEERESNKQGFIILCLDKTSFSFRCKRKAGLPDEHFKLKSNDFEYQVSASSSPIISDKLENSPIVSWEKDCSATTEGHNFRYKGEKYKIFTPAEEFGISGWISNQRYSPEKLFYLVVHKDLFEKVQEWGSKECEQCKELKFSGLPKNWHLFEIKGVKGDSLIKDIIPALSIDKKQRIQFKGGIRSKGNKFFYFAPPKLSVTGGIEQSNLYWFSKSNEKREALISSNQDKSLFSLPKNIPIGERIMISNKDSGLNSNEEERKLSFMFSKNYLKSFSKYSEGLKMNRFGVFNINNENSVSRNSFLQGAYGSDLKSIESFQRLPNFLLLDMKKAYLIGRRSGEISILPRESLPELWAPCWMIQRQSWNKFTAHFLGNKESFVSKSSLQNLTKEKIQLWKKIIWYRRKRIKPDKKYGKKWKLFLKEVSGV